MIGDHLNRQIVEIQ